MQFSIKDRFALLGILESYTGSFIMVKVVHELKMNLAPSAKELKKIEYVQTGALATWNTAKDPNKEIELDKVSLGIIESQLRRLDAEQRLTTDHLDLYQRFVIGEKEEKSDGEGA